MSDATVPAVTHDAGASQFELRTPSGTALLRYVLRGEALDLVHTEVPAAEEGRGLGTVLVEAALAYAREQKVQVIPSCPFVRHYFDEHPDHGALVAGRSRP